jgi:adenosylcobinamide-GDP ribazoletransferase
VRKALSFLTPLGPASAPDQMTVVWFPIVGALIGLAVGGIWWLAAKVWAPLPAAAIVVLGDLALTGFLHFDGLADFGDGLLPPLSRERRLEVMADPAVGAFGAVCVGVTLVLRVASLSSIAPAVLVIAGLWCASRTTMVVMTQSLPYARPTGLVKDFIAQDTRSRRQQTFVMSSLVLGYILAGALVLVGHGLRGLGALGGELVAMVCVAWFSWRRINGFTGDVLGAAGVIGETIGLLIFVTR